MISDPSFGSGDELPDILQQFCRSVAISTIDPERGRPEIS
jgi:hypothetical protein